MNDLQKTIRPGDIINLSGLKVSIKSFSDFFKTLGVAFAVGGIVETQKRVFGPETPGVVDNHTMIYLGDKRVFSTHLPKPEIVSLEEFFDTKRTVRLLRPSKKYFGVNFCDDEIVNLIRQSAESIVEKSKKYDIGQLLDILANTLIGSPHDDSVVLFQGKEAVDVGIDEKKRQNLVCSVSVALILEDVLSQCEKMGKKVKLPWAKIKRGTYLDNKFFGGIGRKYPGSWDIDVVFPAQFACTQEVFGGEFDTVGLFKGGMRLDGLKI